MLRLLVIRHAKSSWKHPELKDYERPLNKRGRNDSPLMGNILRERGIQLDGIYTSTAIRALSTARLIARELNFDLGVIREIEGLYGPDVNQMLDFIRNNPSFNEQSIAVISHNPAITDFANHLLGGKQDLNFPTCAVAAIDFDVARWDQVGEGQGHLAFYEYPKKHKK